MLKRSICALGVILLLGLGNCWAQESRGSITGRVMDPQGAVIPSAQVTITNTETNLVSRTITNDTGYFEVNLLNPGAYAVTVEAPGFKKSVRSGLQLNVAGRLDLEMQLQVGQLAETVEVTAEAPLLDTTTASGGRIVDNRQIMQLPFSDMNPFALAGLAPGMQWTGTPEYRRPFDNAGTSAFNTAGAVGQNEYTIDGAPVTGTGRRVGFVPPSDAVEEFRLETATFDASYGHTSGATINVMTKSGTNTYHGSLYDQHWQQRWNGTPHFDRLRWEQEVAQGKRSQDSPKQATGRSNNFGGTLGGPLRIPKLYNGSDKMFFFFSYNGIYQKKSETTDNKNRTVPRPAWRTGDFSDLLAVDARKYTIYDPRSASSQGGRVVRTPFPGNKGVPILNPVYDFYSKLYPQPNDVAGLVTPEGINNYLASGMPKDERFNSLVNRWDYNVNERHRVFGRWYWNHRLADEYDWTYETVRGLHSNGLTRINKGAGASYIWTLSASSVLDIGVSWTRFNEGSSRPTQLEYKPSDVGLPAYVDERAGPYASLPRLDFNNISDVSDAYPAISSRGTTGEIRFQFNTIKGDHSLKYGYQERRYWFTAASPGDSSGKFDFRNNYTRAADNDNLSSSHALDWASFMMGLPTSINIAGNDTAYWSTRFRSLFIHDDWRLSNRLRVNLGLRYEREGGTTERFNRGLAGGIVYDMALPISDAAEAAYAANQIPELPASQFKVRGGVTYLGDKWDTYTDGVHHFLPRAGVVYQLNGKTVLRGGYGWYYDTLNVNNDRPRQDGFSQGTGTPLTNDFGLSFCCDVGSAANLASGRNPLTNPFPVRANGTRFDEPFRDSLGAMRLVNVNDTTWLPRDYTPAWQQRWRIGIQRELTSAMVIEVSYNGAFSKIPVAQRLDFLPEQYWATGMTRNQSIDDGLNRTVTNPFYIGNFAALEQSDPTLYSYMANNGFFQGRTIRKDRLLRPFPHMSDFNGVRPGLETMDVYGGNRYHDLQIQFERRFTRGFQSAVLYTYSYGEEQDWYRNDFDDRPTYRPQNDIRPHRFVWSAIWEMPFGKGRRWVDSGPMQHVIGGWQLSWVYQYQNGGPTGDWGNRFFYGDLNNIGDAFKHEQVNGKDLHQWFDGSIAYRGTGVVPSGFQGFEGRTASQPGSYHVRVFPIRLSSLRTDGIRNWDVKVLRRFRITERLNTNFSVDMLNATNHTNFSGPNLDPTNANFGKVTSQRGLSRVIQFNLRVDF